MCDSIENCNCKCVVCVMPGRCHKDDLLLRTFSGAPPQPQPQPKDDDVGQLLERKLRGYDARPERDNRPPPMCCERLGNGSWCWLTAGHPTTTPHEGAKPRMAAHKDPDLKFATGKHGNWNDPKGIPSGE